MESPFFLPSVAPLVGLTDQATPRSAELQLSGTEESLGGAMGR